MSVDPHTLVITIEHADTGKMGGIGSYNAETDKFADGVLFLLIDDEILESPKQNIILCKNYIAQRRPDLLTLYESTLDDRSFAVYQVVKDILEKNPSIHKVSTHEYSGLGAATATAARLGLLPGVVFRVHCHGGHVQLERATGGWEGPDIDVLDAERITIENADEIYFPARYLHDLYEASGIKMDPSKVKYLGFPYEIKSGLSNPAQYQDIENIVFVGRANKLKGFDVFADVVGRIVAAGGAKSLRRVVVIGKDDGSLASVRDNFIALLKRGGIAYEQGLRTRQETLAEVSNLSTNSIFLLPYYSDNFSVAMLEVVEVGAPLLVLDTGGNRDLIDSEHWRDCVAKNSEELYVKTEALINLSSPDRGALCVALQQDFFKLQKGIDDKNRELYSSSRSRVDKSVAGDPLTNLQTIRLGAYISGSQAHPYIDVTTGECTIKLVDADRYILIADSMELIEGGAQSISQHIHSADDVYVYGFTDLVGKTTIPRGLSIGALSFNPQHHNSYIFSARGKDVAEFLEGYQHAPAGAVDRTLDDFMYSFALAMRMRDRKDVHTVPLIVAIQVRDVGSWEFEEKVIFNAAHYAVTKQWDTFRHMALTRHARINAEKSAVVIDSEIDSFIAADSTSSRLMRALIRRQVGLIALAKRIKRHLYL